MITILIILILITMLYTIITYLKDKLFTTTLPKQHLYEQNLSKYYTNNYIMTQTELKFYKQLKKITDKLELTIFSQVNLERIINVKDNNISDRNRIKSRSIDFVITKNDNCKIICCIELDDYTHNYNNVKETDNFKNELFKKVNIPLHRIKVNNYYNLNEIETIIKGDLT